MRSDDDLTAEAEPGGWQAIVLPVLVLLVVVGVVCVLVFTGVVAADEERAVPDGSSTTASTIQIAP